MSRSLLWLQKGRFVFQFHWSPRFLFYDHTGFAQKGSSNYCHMIPPILNFCDSLELWVSVGLWAIKPWTAPVLLEKEWFLWWPVLRRHSLVAHMCLGLLHCVLFILLLFSEEAGHVVTMLQTLHADLSALKQENRELRHQFEVIRRAHEDLKVRTLR